MSEGKLTPKDYQDAIDVQDACNLSGVVISFAAVMHKICNETVSDLVVPRRLDTREKNGHPIAVMYASKIAQLTGCENGMAMAEAYNACILKSKGL